MIFKKYFRQKSKVTIFKSIKLKVIKIQKKKLFIKYNNVTGKLSSIK